MAHVHAPKLIWLALATAATAVAAPVQAQTRSERRWGDAQLVQE